MCAETDASFADVPDLGEVEDLLGLEGEPTDQQTVMRYAGPGYRPLGSLSELLPILRPLFVPAALPLSERPGGGRRLHSFTSRVFMVTRPRLLLPRA